MQKFKYRVQIEMVNHGQVDVVSDTPLDREEINELAIQQAWSEYGRHDESEVSEIALVSLPVPADQPRVKSDVANAQANLEL